MKKKLLLFLISTLLFSLLLFATGCEEVDYLFAYLDDESAAKTTEQKDARTVEQTAGQTAAPQDTTEQATEPEPELEAEADLEYCKRAAVTAMTNYNAVDIFDNSGKIAQSKLHKYSDTSGDPQLYFMYVSSWGTWTAQSENGWRVETLKLKAYGGYQDEYRFNLDVSFDSENDVYTISNVYGFFKEAGKSSYVSMGECVSSHELFRIPVSFVSEDRNEAAVKALDHSGRMNETRARMAFENYVNSYCSNFGYAVKFNRYITHLQDYTGSWYFECIITVTNTAGAKEQMTASAYINVVTQAVEDFAIFD